VINGKEGNANGLSRSLFLRLLGWGMRFDPGTRDCKTNSANCFRKKSFGTHYGGSPYSSTDPFYMLVLIENLEREHIVWDKTDKAEPTFTVEGRYDSGYTHWECSFLCQRRGTLHGPEPRNHATHDA
jgi:hypothetical protein